MAHLVRTSRYGPHDPDYTASLTVTVMRAGRVEVEVPLPFPLRRQIAQMNGLAHCGSTTCRHRRRKATKR
jgi:hypothetical protein